VVKKIGLKKDSEDIERENPSCTDGFFMKNIKRNNPEAYFQVSFIICSSGKISFWAESRGEIKG